MIVNVLTEINALAFYIYNSQLQKASAFVSVTTFYRDWRPSFLQLKIPTA